MAYKPFPVGTVRGPYVCGKGNDPTGGYQFLVQTKGGWVPFIGSRAELEDTRQRANQYAEQQLKPQRNNK